MDMFSVTVVPSPMVSLSMAIVTFAAARATWNWVVTKYNEYESKVTPNFTPAQLVQLQALLTPPGTPFPTVPQAAVNVNINEETIVNKLFKKIQENAGAINNVRVP
jgi:hypothetical protein